MNDTSLIFTGDIGFDKYMDGRWEDEDLLDKGVKDFLSGARHIIANVEGPLYDGSKVASIQGSAAKLLHSMKPAVGDFLTSIGADIWNICNNHIMDSGPDGLCSTIGCAEKCGAAVLGAGMDIEAASTPVIINEAGGIGMIGVGYQRACRKADDKTPGCFSWSDLDLIAKRIKEIKINCRWCIVVAHAGEEFTALPSPYTRDRYISYLDMGADIVIAHHPHVVNNYELIGEKAIFYSLGNFIFDTDYQRSQFGTQYGILLRLDLFATSFSFTPFGIEVDRTCEKIIPCKLPAIFTDVCANEYELLKGLSAKVLIENTKRQLRYMRPDEFANATEDDFYNNFYEPLRSGRVPGETLDMQIIYPLSLTEKEGHWKSSTLHEVVSYMRSQIPQ